MPLSVRNMIAVLVTIVILAGVFYTATLYYPTRKRAVRVAKSLALLQAQLEAASPTGGESQKKGVMTDALTMDVNFFSKRNLTPQSGIPELLEQINRISNEMNIRFVTIKPLDEEEAAEYRKYPFLIETRAAYPELVNFVNRIENGMRLSLSNLQIERDPKDVSMHRLQFTLNIVELTDDVDFGPEIWAETVSPDSKNMELVAVFRDVFSPKQGTTVAQLPKPPESASVVKKKPRPPKLNLMGIMEIAGKRVAIINDRIVRPGQIILKQRVERIEDDRVIIVRGDQEYSLFLKGSTPGK
jgi:Tfp pilus assembly protein PilO